MSDELTPRQREVVQGCAAVFLGFVLALPDLWCVYLFLAAIAGWWPWP